MRMLFVASNVDDFMGTLISASLCFIINYIPGTYVVSLQFGFFLSSYS